MKKNTIFKTISILLVLLLFSCSMATNEDSSNDSNSDSKSNDTIAPTVKITSPINSSKLIGKTLIKVDATDNTGIEKVEFYAGDTLLETDKESPYQYEWNIYSSKPGANILKAVAIDTAGNKAEDDINISLDFKVIISPFDDNNLAPDSHWGGAGTSETAFTSGAVTFYHTAETHSWSGFVYSNKTDTTTAGYTNQFSAYTKDAANGNPGGYNGSANYAISYVALDYAGGTYDPIPSTACITGSSSTGINGFYITNTTYAYLSMTNGDGFAKKFGGTDGSDEDWFLLTIKGMDKNGAYTGTVEFYLADYRFSDNTKDYIIDEWTWVDLTSLGEVVVLEFSLTSSDTGAYGMNTPAYFAMDDLSIIE